MGAIMFRHGVALTQARKDLEECVVSGERLRQDARRVADTFHDPEVTSEIVRTVTADWEVNEWVEKKGHWAGRSSNVLRDLLSARESADAFRRVVSVASSADSGVDAQARLDQHLDALDKGLTDLRRLAFQLERESQEAGAEPARTEEDTSVRPAPIPTHDTAVVPAHAAVFLVHGRNEHIKLDVARTLEMSGDHEVVILHEVPDRGRTIIQKFEEEAAAAAYAVVLVTGDDIGRLDEGVADQPRARQNVIFELGWFAGRLGRSRVTVLYERGVELPSDYGGVTYTALDDQGAWRGKLVRELIDAGLSFDANKLRG